MQGRPVRSPRTGRRGFSAPAPASLTTLSGSPPSPGNPLATAGANTLATPVPIADAPAPSHVDEGSDVPVVDAPSLKVSAIEGAVSSVMTGTSESYLGAFAVALGHSDLHLALLTTAPYVCGAVAQLLARQL